MKTIIGIYKIENTKSNKLYIGSSKDCRKRKNRHFSELRNNKHKNKHLQSAYNKYGKENFTFSVIEELKSENSLITKEQYYINRYCPEYNINLIANSSLGVKRSNETKDKIRRANLGLEHPKWRNEIKSKAQGGDNHWTKSKDKPFSVESREKMSESHKKLYKNGYKHPRAKAVIQYSLDDILIKEFISIAEAGRQLNLNSEAIARCCKGLSKTSGKYKWKYKNSYD
jgi:group I intron endonuclease